MFCLHIQNWNRILGPNMLGVTKVHKALQHLQYEHISLVPRQVSTGPQHWKNDVVELLVSQEGGRDSGRFTKSNALFWAMEPYMSLIGSVPAQIRRDSAGADPERFIVAQGLTWGKGTSMSQEGSVCCPSHNGYSIGHFGAAVPLGASGLRIGLWCCLGCPLKTWL